MGKKVSTLGARAGLWALLLAVLFSGFDHGSPFGASAYGDSVQMYTHTDTSTSLVPTATKTQNQTAANGQVIPEVTVEYRTDTHITTTTTTNSNTSSAASTSTQQQASELNSQKLNNNGASQATELGMAAIGAGMGLVATGVALNASPCACGAGPMAAGAALIAAGVAGLAAAAQMNQHANTAGNNAGDLGAYAGSAPNAGGFGNSSTDSSSSGSSLSGTNSNSTAGGTNSSGASGSNIANGGKNGSGSNIAIDPALLHTGTLDSIYSKMETQTGLKREDVAAAVASGQNPLAILANSPAMAGKPGASQDNLQKLVDDAASKSPPLSPQDVMSRLGLKSDDLAANGASGDVALAGSGGGSRSPSSGGNGMDFDSLFPSSDRQAALSGTGAASGNAMKISQDVQSALDRNGITSYNIFEMVHHHYVKMTPLLFGVVKKVDGAKPNPFVEVGDKP